MHGTNMVKNGKIYNGRDNLKNSFSYFDFTIFFSIVKRLFEPKTIFVKEGITSPLLLGSRDNKCKK